MPDINSQKKNWTAIIGVGKACIQEYPSLPDELVDGLINISLDCLKYWFGSVNNSLDLLILVLITLNWLILVNISLD